jgi:hypothetical protein
MIHKLSITTPDPKLVNQYLKTIAQAYDVQWEEHMEAPATYEAPTTENQFEPPPQLSFQPPITKAEEVPSAPQIPSVPGNQDKEPDFDHLSKRFEILKQKK